MRARVHCAEAFEKSEAAVTKSYMRYVGKVVQVSVRPFAFPDGSRAEMEVVHHPGAAAVVALNAANEVCLLRQYRHVFGAWVWELPAGKRDDGEHPLLTAQRELAEEAGLTARDWQLLGEMWSSPGVFDEVVHLYLARDLTTVPPAPRRTIAMTGDIVTPPGR